MLLQTVTPEVLCPGASVPWVPAAIPAEAMWPQASTGGQRCDCPSACIRHPHSERADRLGVTPSSVQSCPLGPPSLHNSEGSVSVSVTFSPCAYRQQREGLCHLPVTMTAAETPVVLGLESPSEMTCTFGDAFMQDFTKLPTGKGQQRGRADVAHLCQAGHLQRGCDSGSQTAASPDLTPEL